MISLSEWEKQFIIVFPSWFLNFKIVGSSHYNTITYTTFYYFLLLFTAFYYICLKIIHESVVQFPTQRGQVLGSIAHMNQRVVYPLLE